MYTADWNSIKLSAAYTYTWEESAALSGSFLAGFCDPRGQDGTSACIGDQNSLHNDNLHQIGASILHKPSGLGIFGQYTHEETGGHCQQLHRLRQPIYWCQSCLLQHQHAYGHHLVPEALLAEDLEPDRRHHPVRRIRSI